jgi:hypothetical protein
MLFLTSALGIVTIATLSYLASGRRPESRFTLVVSLVLLAALFAFLPLSRVPHLPVPLLSYPQTTGNSGEVRGTAQTDFSAAINIVGTAVSVPGNTREESVHGQ